MTADRITWTGVNLGHVRAFCNTGTDQRFVLHAGGLGEIWSDRDRVWLTLRHGDVVTRDADGNLSRERGASPAEPRGGSDSPHAADAREKLQEALSPGDYRPVLRALVSAVLAVADELDELDETRRQQHLDAIDVANAVSAVAGALTPPEPLYAEYTYTWRDRLRIVFGGAL